ncbi:helix-turn-helix transcriptional regulator [Shewanella sp. Scap07]|uniref:helix-turn-helix domain-containing protein n=1 Tax=Shewanella sp. Scap07 TaxID=2589987 RepID=UPI0015C10A19|nr:helix-turn-helix transcriptional regulator [Shewanella sp. Scap07]QLE87315.1 helix-turn-helix transcriptional regulator [Shewanella sp. Scap07]
MDINAASVKQLRQQRGWTQQHLADACNISIRTIQRIEKEGAASNETLLGLCAVFEVEQQVLRQVPHPEQHQLTTVSVYQQPGLLIIAAVIGAFIGAAVMYLFIR